MAEWLTSEWSSLPSVARLANGEAVCSRLIRGVSHMSRRKLSFALALMVVLFACTAPLDWYAACGCAEQWTGVVGDVGVYWADIKVEDVTPEFLAEKTLAKLKGKSMDLETIRGVGLFFNSSCASVLLEVRCTFWMWAREQELKGIEVQFFEGDGKVNRVTAKYVYSNRGGSRG